MIKVNVEINNKSWRNKIKNPKKYFKTRLKKITENINFFKRKNITFTILLTDSLNIKKLNKKFRNKNKATDVLSFPSEKKLNIKKSPYIGDIVFSYEFMNKPKALSTSEFKNKVTKIFIHGFLHLLGYDHIKLNDYKKMLVEEEKIYQIIETKIVKLV